MAPENFEQNFEKMTSIAVPDDSFNVKLIKALGINQEYVTSIRILSQVESNVVVEVEYLLADENGEHLIELLQEYYLVEKPNEKEITLKKD